MYQFEYKFYSSLNISIYLRVALFVYNNPSSTIHSNVSLGNRIIPKILLEVAVESISASNLRRFWWRIDAPEKILFIATLYFLNDNNFQLSNIVDKVRC